MLADKIEGDKVANPVCATDAKMPQWSKTTQEPHFNGWRISLAWHDIRFVVLAYSLEYTEPPMGEVIRFVPKAELERARLIREARVIYEYIFPPADQTSKRPEPDK